MNKQILKDTIGWGFGLWLIGYALGFAFFVIVPPSILGWVIMPIGTIVTIWVLFRKVKSELFRYYLLLAFVWTIIAIVLDYFLLVKLLKPVDEYYKLDVYFYYILTFILPIIVGFSKKKSKNI